MFLICAEPDTYNLPETGLGYVITFSSVVLIISETSGLIYGIFEFR